MALVQQQQQPPPPQAPAVRALRTEQQYQQQQTQHHHQQQSQQQQIPGFKDILHKKTATERIQAFDLARYQIYQIDTGLNNWIEATMLSRPEYSDIMEQNERFAAANQKLMSAAKSNKFPRLPSLGNFTSHLDAGSSLRRPSPSLGSQRSQLGDNNPSSSGGAQRGKVLHTAGVLGGKAGDAAKELLNKGRSKLRNTEKVQQDDN